MVVAALELGALVAPSEGVRVSSGTGESVLKYGDAVE